MERKESSVDVATFVIRKPRVQTVEIPEIPVKTQSELCEVEGNLRSRSASRTSIKVERRIPNSARLTLANDPEIPEKLVRSASEFIAKPLSNVSLKNFRNINRDWPNVSKVLPFFNIMNVKTYHQKGRFVNQEGYLRSPLSTV